MTEILFEKRKDGKGYRFFRFRGHAGYAAKGDDIVCAALSVLVINTINALETLCHAAMEVSSDEKAGEIVCRFPSEQSEKEILLLDALLLGAQGVEQEYGKKFVTIRVKEV